ncbi:MAG: TonB-dependent receptor [Marinifilaceae bacterium]|nr:TonB-dependent receptor [Marinifilaceae bacterium]
MKKNILCVLVTLMVTVFSVSAQSINFTGKLVDKQTNKVISGASVSILGSKLGSTTNDEGLFYFNDLPNGEYQFEFSFIGFKTVKKIVNINSRNTFILIQLVRDDIVLNSVNVNAKLIHRTETSFKLIAPLKDIPLSSVSVESDVIEQRGITSVNDALKNASGITPLINYGGFQTFTMRGFGSPVIMLDGARDERMNFSNSAPVTSLASVERIEFLKGPASVLYGHSAVGGIVNIVQKQPSDRFTANFEATYGTWNTKNVFMGAGDKLSDKLSYRFDLGLSDRDGWRDNGDKTANAYLALNYRFNDYNLLEFRFNANDDFYGTETGLPAVKNDVFSKTGSLVYKAGDLPSSFDIKQRFNDPSDFLTHKSQAVSIKFYHLFKDKSSLTFKASFNHDIIDYFSTEELSYLTSDDPIYDSYYMSSGKKKYINLNVLKRSYPLRFSHHTNTYQHFIDYNKKFKIFNIKNNFLAGLFTMNIDRTSFKGYNLGSDVKGPGLYAQVNVIDPVLNQGNIQTSFSGASLYNEWVNAIYFQDLISISDKFKAMIGARYDYFVMENQSAKVKGEHDIFDKSDAKKMKNNSFTYRAGLVYQPLNDLSVYTSISSFFKPKRSVYNKNYVYIDNNGKEFKPSDDGEVFKPESGYQIELGFKYSINSMINFNASTYYILKNNIVENLGKTTDGKRIYGQVGVVDSKGFELDLILKPINGLKVTAGYGFNEAKYKDFADNKYSKNSNKGNIIPRCPQNQFHSWVYYTFNKGFLKNLGLGFGFNYRDKIYTNTSNSFELSEYSLMDASLAYSLNKVFFRLKINNLADKKHFTNTVYSNQYIPGYGRNVMFSVGINL